MVFQRMACIIPSGSKALRKVRVDDRSYLGTSLEIHLILIDFVETNENSNEFDQTAFITNSPHRVIYGTAPLYMDYPEFRTRFSLVDKRTCD